MQRTVAQEATTQAAPARFAEHGAANRKTFIDHAAQVVEDQFAIHPCPPHRQPLRASAASRIAQMRREVPLKLLEAGRHHATRLSRRAAACNSAIRPTSAVNPEKWPKLKSRSRQVGTSPPMRA